MKITLTLLLLLSLTIYGIQNRVMSYERGEHLKVALSEQVIIQQAKWNVEHLIEQAKEAGWSEGFALGVLSQQDEEPDNEQDLAYSEACEYVQGSSELQELLSISELDSCAKALKE